MLLNSPVRNGRDKLPQNISVRGNILIRGNLHKCLECGGFNKLVRENGIAKLTGFQPRNRAYVHLPECKQKHLI